MLSKDLIISYKDTKLFLTDPLFNTKFAEFDFVSKTVAKIRVDVENNLLYVVTHTGAYNHYSYQVYAHTFNINEIVTEAQDAVEAQAAVPAVYDTDGITVLTPEIPAVEAQDSVEASTTYELEELFERAFGGNTSLHSNITFDNDKNMYFITYYNSTNLYINKIDIEGTRTYKNFGTVGFGRQWTYYTYHDIEFDAVKNNLVFTVEGTAYESNGINGGDYVIMDASNFDNFETFAINPVNGLYYNTWYYPQTNHAFKLVDMRNRKINLVTDNMGSRFVEADIDTHSIQMIDSVEFSNSKLGVNNVRCLTKDSLTQKTSFWHNYGEIPGIYDFNIELSVEERNDSFIDMKYPFIYNPATNDYLEFITDKKIRVHNTTDRQNTTSQDNVLAIQCSGGSFLPSNLDMLKTSRSAKNEVVYPLGMTGLSTTDVDIVIRAANTNGKDTQQFRVFIDRDSSKIKNIDPRNPVACDIMVDSFASGEYYSAGWKYCTDFNELEQTGHDLDYNGTWVDLGSADGMTASGVEPTNGVINQFSDITEKYIRKVVTLPELGVDYYIKVFSNIKK